MAKTTLGASGFDEFIHALEGYLRHWYEDHLGDTLAHLDFIRCIPPVPARHKHLALIVRIDQPYQIAQHDAMFVAQSRARQ